MAVKGLDIFKLSPKKNCKECGSPTCMAFCMKVAQGAVEITKCPYMSAEAVALLSEATAPPMKTITVGEHKLGGETVMMRHEKTLVNRNLFAATLCTCMDDAKVEERIEGIKKVDYERIGEREMVECVFVHDAGDSAKFVELCKKAAAIGDRTVIIDTKDVDTAKAAVEAIKDNKPILNGANKDNFAAMNEIATAAGIVLGVHGADLSLSVNELLTGERISETEYREKAEENMVNLVKEAQESKKKIILSGMVSALVIIAATPMFVVAGAFPMEDWMRIALIAVGIVVIVIGIAIACILDRDAGAYECPECKTRFVPEMGAYVMGPHTLTRRKLVCPHCGAHRYCKKVLTR